MLSRILMTLFKASAIPSVNNIESGICELRKLNFHRAIFVNTFIIAAKIWATMMTATKVCSEFSSKNGFQHKNDFKWPWLSWFLLLRL